MAAGLAVPLHQPVHFVEIESVPVIRHQPHQGGETAGEVGITGNEAQPLRYPQHMGIDDEDALV